MYFPHSEHPTILLVEDNLNVGKTIKILLETMNFMVRWAKTFDQGVQLINEHLKEAHAILIDGDLAGISGVDLIQHIKEIEFDGIIVAISGDGNLNEEIIKEGILHSLFIQRLDKPFRIGPLKTVLKS